ncbi:MAG: hypothetical protein ABSF18_05265 [Gammaproteobacteria bacterium]|jgi:hypothetical protein
MKLIKKLCIFILTFFYGHLAFAQSAYIDLLSHASEAIDANDPITALDIYHDLHLSAKTNQSETYQRIALFRIARIQMWLGDYDAASEIYKSLLASDLDATDYQIALAGLVDSLSYNDKSFTADEVADNNNPEQVDNPDLIIANARAALWSNQPYKAKSWLEDYEGESSLAFQNLDFFTNQAAANYFIEPYFRFEHDTDDLTIYKTGMSAGHRWNKTQTSNLLAAYQQYNQNADSAHGEILGVSQIMHLIEQTLHLGVGINAIHFDTDWSPWTGFVDLFYQAQDEWAVNLYADKSLVDTYYAVANEITVNSYGVDLFYMPNYRTQFSLSPYYKNFTDGNARYGITASSDILLWPSFGLGVRPQVRYFEDSKQLDTNNYFNPSEYIEGNLFLTLQQWILPTWSWYVEAGPGYQNTHPGEDGMTYLAEGGVSGAITDITYLNAFVGYTNASYSSASGYSNSYAGIAFTIAFD